MVNLALQNQNRPLNIYTDIKFNLMYFCMDHNYKDDMLILFGFRLIRISKN